MLQTIEKSMFRTKISPKRTLSVTTSVKSKDRMELRNFLENSNDKWLFIIKLKSN